MSAEASPVSTAVHDKHCDYVAYESAVIKNVRGPIQFDKPTFPRRPVCPSTPTSLTRLALLTPLAPSGIFPYATPHAIAARIHKMQPVVLMIWALVSSKIDLTASSY